LVAIRTCNTCLQSKGCAKSHNTSKPFAAEDSPYVHHIPNTLTPLYHLTHHRRVQSKAFHFPNQRRPSELFSTKCTKLTTLQPAPSSPTLLSDPKSKRNAQWRSYSTSSSHLTRSVFQSHRIIRTNTNTTTSTTSRK
jgi:hypothetical protein